jgi:peptide/nickel transport system substrate-binding protein
MRLSAEPLYRGIAGATACRPRRCDLSKGIETEASARTITIHLRRPDAEFAHKLALPLAYVLPAGTPVAIMRRRPALGTGPYRITTFVPAHSVRLERNPRFRSWSAQARPDGFPDTIDVGISSDPAAQVAAVRHGRADAVVVAGAFSIELPPDQARALALADPSHLRSAAMPYTNYLVLNVRERPFDDARVRQALSYAIDRRRMVSLMGGRSLAALSCQVIPPGLPGYVPRCPFTRDPTPAGHWSAPDLARARRLVTASGTRGARVQMTDIAGPYQAVGRYTVSVLRRLGYRAQTRLVPDSQYFKYLYDPRRHNQVAFVGWIADFLTPSTFFGQFTCRERIGTSTPGENIAQFCDHAVDAGYDAALAAQGAQANARWAALDARVAAAAPLVPLFNPRLLMLVADRTGNPQVHLQLGPLLDQFWVH